MLWREAERQLRGVGDAAAGEWREVGRTAVHLKRRLTEREQRTIGPALDIRHSDEAWQRAARLPAELLRLAPSEVLEDELGSL